LELHSADEEGVIMKKLLSIIVALAAISMMGLVNGYAAAADYPVKPISTRHDDGSNFKPFFIAKENLGRQRIRSVVVDSNFHRLTLH